MADRDYFQELSDLDDAPEAEEPAVGVSETARALETDGVFKSLTDQQAQDREVERGKGIFGSFYEAVSGAVTGMRNDPALRSLALTPIEGAIRAADSPLGPGEATKALARGYVNDRGSLASGVEQFATSAGFEGLAGAAGEQAKGMRDLAMSKALKARVESLGKISKEHWFKDTIDYGLSAIGEGIGSSIAFGAAGVVGGVPGVLALGYTSSLGELREELKEAGVADEAQVAKYAYLAAIPHSILDTLTERGVMKGLTAPAKKEVRRGILRLIMGGAVREGVTEASQRVIELAATAHANGGEAPNAAVIASLFADVNKGADSTILESGVRGALPGAVFGGGQAAAQEARVRTRGTTADVEPGAAATQEAAPPDSRVIDLDGYSPVPLQREQDAPQGGTEARPVTTPAAPLETVEAAPESTAGQETGVPTGVAASEVSAQLPDDVADYIRRTNPTLARTYGLVDEETAEAAAPQADPMAAREIVTPEGSMTVQATPEVVDLADLKLAAGALQPRDRSRAESTTNIRQIAANLDPEQLLPARVSDGGAPIVSADGTVISGNGRVMALSEAYRDPALKASIDRYRGALGAQAANMAEPVLIMRLPADMPQQDMRRFADLSNRSRVSAMSATERALRDANAASADVMGLYVGGSFTSPANQEFFRAFTGKAVLPAERGAFSRNGVLTKEGEDRMSAAILAAAYGDRDLIARMLESTDDNIRNVTSAMRDAAGAFIRLKEAIRVGVASEQFDISAQIAETAKRIADLRDRGVKPVEFLAQQDAFTQTDPIVETLLRAFYNDDLSRSLSREKLTEVLIRYADEGQKHQANGLIPDETTPGEIIQAVRSRVLGSDALPPSLFEQQPVREGDAGRRDGGRGRDDKGSGVGAGERNPVYEKFREVLASNAKVLDWQKLVGATPEEMNALVDQAVADGLLKVSKAGKISKVRAKAKPSRLGERLSEVMQRGRSEAVERLVSQASPLSIAPDVRIDRAVELRERQTGKAVPSVVTDYANRIEEARGTPAFEPIIAEIKADKLVKKSDVHDLAHLVGYPVSKSTTKQDALATVVKRHQELLASGVMPGRVMSLGSMFTRTIMPFRDRWKAARLNRKFKDEPSAYPGTFASEEISKYRTELAALEAHVARTGGTPELNARISAAKERLQEVELRTRSMEPWSDTAKGYQSGPEELVVPQPANSDDASAYQRAVERQQMERGGSVPFAVVTSKEQDLERFFDEMIAVEPGSALSASSAYEAYALWAEEMGRDVASVMDFNRFAAELGLVKIKGNAPKPFMNASGQWTVAGVGVIDGSQSQQSMTFATKKEAQEFASQFSGVRFVGIKLSRPEGFALYSIAGIAPDAVAADIATGRSQRRILDGLGFYSKLDEALKEFNPTDVVTAETLAKRGVKKAEIEARGMGDLLADGKAAKVSDLQEAAGKSAVEVRESNYGPLTETDLDNVYVAAADDLEAAGADRSQINRFLGQALSYHRTETPTFDAEARQFLPAHLVEQGKAAAQRIFQAEKDTKWRRYSLDPDNPTYRETVLHLPGANRETLSYDAWRKQRWPNLPDDAEMRAKYERSDKLSNLDTPEFRSGHFSEPNIIAHARTSVQKDAQGNDVFVVNELQSDWGQKLRDGGVRDEARIAEAKAAVESSRQVFNAVDRRVTQATGLDRSRTDAERGDALKKAGNYELADELVVASNEYRLDVAELRTAEASTPGHPLVNTTDQWVNTALRRMITQAVGSGADQIAIPSGETIKAFKMGGKEDGISYAYDQMYPKNLRNILQKMDKSVAGTKLDHLYSVNGKTLERSKGFTTFTLTDKIKRSVASEGFALFSLAGSGRPTPPLTPEFEEAVPDVVERLSKELQRMLPNDVAFRITDRLLKSGDLSELFGEYDPVARLLQVALFPRGVYDPVKAFQIARHETVHVLRMSGLFSTQEWELLVNHAKKVKIDDSITVVDEHGNVVPGIPVYRKAYADRLSANYVRRLREAGFFGENLYAALEDYSDSGTLERNVEELIDQERVAKMAETWLVGKATYGSKIEALLARIKKFFEALHNALADLGFQTADDVFQKAFSGEIAGRASMRPNTGPTLYSVRGVGLAASARHLSPFTKDTEIKFDPDYKAAKSGDHEAAGRLVERLVPLETIQSAAAQFGPDAIYVPVIAEEATGNNKIPEMLAHLFGISTGAQVSDDIVQSSRAFHTGARPLERLISRPRFDGPVEAGRRYVLVDDVSVMGGTLAELANHIVSNGGEVVGVVTLVNASRTGEIAPNAKDIAEIEKRYGSLVRDQLGIEPQALTGDEARYILNFRDADALGSSIAKARRERNERLRAKGLRASEEDPEGGLSLASIASVPGDRAKSTSDSLTGTTINVPAELFRWLGVPQAKMQADYSGIARKREASPSADVDLTKPEMVRDFVEDVLTRATFAYRAHADHPSLWDIIVPDTSNRMIGVRLERRGGLYKVSTAHTMRERQVAKKLVAAAREHGPAGIRWKDAPAASTVLAFINRGVASPSGSSTAATLNDVEREGPEHPAIAAVIAALTRSQEGDPEILASIGRLGSGTPVLSADTNRQDTARPEQTLADLVKSVTRALGLTVRQGHIDPGLKRSAAARGNQVAGQFSQATGVTRLAIPNDLATLAHEGGHALEVRPSIRADLDTLKQAHVEELAVAPVQNTPAPTLAPGQGFSGLELDAETQTLAQGAAEADITWRALAASVGAAKAGGGIVSAGSYDQAAYTAAQEEAATSRAALVRRLGRPTADAVIADITKAERPVMAAWIATRYSASGTPQPRPAITASTTELSEGFAEWFRIYVTNRREAASLAPRFMAAFEDMLGEAEPDLLETLSEIERQVDALTKASPIGALRSRVQSTVTPGMFQALREEIADKGLGDTIGDRVYGFYHAFFDARHPMKRAVKFLLRTAADNLGLDLQGKDRLLVKAIDDPYKLWRLSEHSKVHATAALQNGITNTKAGQVDPQGPSFWDALIAAFGGKSRSAWSDENAELFGSYLVARRMLAEFQRFDRGDLEQLPDQVISRDIWNRAKTQLEQKYPDFQAAASLLYAFNRNALKLKLDNGFLSQEVYDDLIQRPDYVPLNRIMDDGSPSALGTSARGTNKRRLIYKFQGSTRDFINPLESIVQDMYATQARIALNDVIRAMDRLARAAGPGGGAIAERLPASEMKGTTVDLREAIKAAARSQNIAQSDKEGLLDIIDDLFDQDAAATIFRTTEINEKGEPIVYLWEGGKKVPIRLGDNRIAKDVFDGFAAFGQDNQNLILDVAALGTQALRAGITKAPAYIMTNFLRDQIATWILSENFTPFATGAKGLKHVVANDQTAARYSAFAGLMGGVDANLIDTAAHKRDVLTLRRKGFSAVPAKSGIGQVWQTVLRAMEVTEAGSRFGHFEAAYQRAIKDGLSPVEAAYEAAYAAHDVMDFSRRGSKMVQVSRIVAFLNASLQGLDVARRTMTGERDSYRNFREQVTPYLKAATGSPLTIAEKKALPNSARFWMKAVAIGMAGVALAALYRDDPEYDEFDDQMRATHWFFKINGTWVRYPKPFELAFFSNLFEAGFDRMWKGNERALTQFLQSLRHTMIPPHEINVVKSYYEWQTGVDLFRGSKIVPTELGALPPEMQFTAYTSELGKLIGSIANLSPSQVDQVMGAMLGTVGRDIMRASDVALPRVNMLLDGALPGVATEPRAEKSFEDSWIVSRFTRRASRGSLSARQFWNEMAQDGGKFIQAAEGYKNLRRAGDVRGARDLIDYLGDEEKAYAYLEGEFTEEEQDIHPLNRARQVLAVSSGIRKNLVLGRLFKEGTTPDARHKDREPEEIIVPPAKQTAVNEILEDISMREARNALVLIGEPGWAQRDILPVEPLLEELRKAAPDVAEEFEVRLTKGKNKIYPFEGVAKVWPLAKGRLIKDGPDADLTDLRIEAAHP